MGAILTQINPSGEHHILGYATCRISGSECNYTPFLLKMQAAIWGMEHFALWDHLLSQHLLANAQLHELIQFFAKDSFVQDQLVWCHLPWPAETNCSVLFLSKTLVPNMTSTTLVDHSKPEK
jgi:hypothetical protein